MSLVMHDCSGHGLEKISQEMRRLKGDKNRLEAEIVRLTEEVCCVLLLVLIVGDAHWLALQLL